METGTYLGSVVPLREACIAQYHSETRVGDSDKDHDDDNDKDHDHDNDRDNDNDNDKDHDHDHEKRKRSKRDDPYDNGKQTQL